MTRIRRIKRDVAVLGGGASGMYTALRLQDPDIGQSVILIEKKDRLGGHTETYHDPVTGQTNDIGVVIYHDLPIVRDLFARFNIALQRFAVGEGAQIKYVDYRTGLEVPFTPPIPVALQKYYQLLQNYPYLTDGFDLPDPVPAELLIPFGQFVQQNDLGDAVWALSQVTQGLGNFLELPTIYVMKNAGTLVLNSLFTNSFQTTAHFNNSELYEKATQYFGNNVLLNADILQVDRCSNGPIEILVDTPDGRVLVCCEKLVVTFPPLLDNLCPFDLDRKEERLFSRFQFKHYSTGIVQLTGVPLEQIANSGSDTPFGLGALPGPYSVYPTTTTNTELRNVKYGSDTPLSRSQAKHNITRDIQRLKTAGTYPDLELQGFKIFKTHQPFELNVSAEEIAAGFYRKLYALQGRNNTYYNGAAFHTHDSTALWQFTENTVLPLLRQE